MNPGKILIIQLRRVGDVIFTLPVIGALRSHFPGAAVDFLVEAPADELVRLHPGLSGTLVYERNRPLKWLGEVRRRKYDWVLDFHSNGRTLWLALASGAKVKAAFEGPVTRRLVYTHRVRTTDKEYLPEQKLDILRALGVPCGRWEWDLKIPHGQAQWAEEFLLHSRVHPGETVVGLAPATRRPIRAWREERWAEAAEKILARKAKVLFLWGPGEKDLIDRVVRRIKNPEGVIVPPELPLIKLAALIDRCSAVLAVDNGPKNLAVALGVPSITLSGPTNPLSFDRQGDPRHAVIRDGNLHCISCGLNLCPYNHECMDHITAENVAVSLLNLISQKNVIARRPSATEAI